MGEKRYISETQVRCAFENAMETGVCEFSDNYGNSIEYSVDPDRKFFHIKKQGSIGSFDRLTFGELFLKSLTGDKCKLSYIDANTGVPAYSTYWDVVLVNIENHPQYGSLIRLEDRYVIDGGGIIF